MKGLQTHVESLYGKFVGLVANGRGLTPETVHKYAEGRVWVGKDAHELGLVQELGGLYDAIDRAAELAELGDDFEVIEIPEVSNPMDEFEEMLDAEAKVRTSSQMTTLQALAGASGLKDAESVIRALDNPRRTYSWLSWYRGSFGFRP